MRQIYLDNNATTPTDERVVQAMLPFFRESYANPGSRHLFGLTVEEQINEAREKIAELIQAKPEEIVFTSGATESVNLAIKGLSGQPRKHIVTIATEHSAVLDTCRYMESIGYEVTYLDVASDGLIDLEMLRKAVTPASLLVSVMLVNNETGVLQPINEIGEIAHANGALLLCDATQAVGKIEIDVSKAGIDLMPVSAHKFYGPKGAGALYVASHVKPVCQIHGGNQQAGLRSGTLNTPGIIGMAAACEIALSEMAEDQERIGVLRDKLEIALLSCGRAKVNGNREFRIYNTSNICFEGVLSEDLIIALQNISVSSGSACQSVTSRPSHVLKAMGLTDIEALSSIRFSLGRFTTSEDIDQAIKTITAKVELLRSR